MGRRKPPALPARVQELRSRLDDWRRSRKKRSRIPEAVWEAAVPLARAHGVNPIAQALRLNYYGLKRRLRSAEGSSAAREASRPTFVELDVSQPAGRAQCIIELEDRRGAKMTIRLEGSGEVDVVGLTGSFWRRRR